MSLTVQFCAHRNNSTLTLLVSAISSLHTDFCMSTAQFTLKFWYCHHRFTVHISRPYVSYFSGSPRMYCHNFRIGSRFCRSMGTILHKIFKHPESKFPFQKIITNFLIFKKKWQIFLEFIQNSLKLISVTPLKSSYFKIFSNFSIFFPQFPKNFARIFT